MTQAGIRALVVGTILLAAAQRPARASNSCGGTFSLKYYGGPLVQNPKVVAVFWNANVSTPITTTMPAFYTAILNSSYIDWLSEYDTVGMNGQDGQPGSNQGISRGTYGGSYTITPSTCAGATACTVSDAQIQAELTRQIDGGMLPAPAQGCDGQISTIYALHFPSNVTVTYAGGNSCSIFCYYHGTGTYNGKPLIYTVNPDVTTGPCAGGCGNNATAINNQTSVASAALFNAITDPNVGLATGAATGRPIAWYADTCGEIGGICNALQGTLAVGTETWTVQKQWSRAANDCIVTRPSLPAICTGAGTPTGCRACACADDGQGAAGQIGCSGATPRCDVTAADLTYGQCVTAGSGGAGGSGGSGGTTGGSGGSGGTTGGSGGSGGSAGGTGGSDGVAGGGARGGRAGGSGGAGGSTGGGGGAGGAGGGSTGAGGGTGGKGGQPDGTEGGACYGNGTCNAGLTCLSHLCVMAPKSGGGGCGCALSGARADSALACAALMLGIAATLSRHRRRRD